MEISEKILKKILVLSGHISEADFISAVNEAKNQKKILLDVLINKGLIKDEQLGQLIATEKNYKFVNLRKEKIDESVLNLIPELVARSKGVIVFARNEHYVKIGMVNPEDLEIKHLIEKRLEQKAKLYYITKQDLSEALGKYKLSLKDEFNNFLEHLQDKTITREARDEIFVKTVDMLLDYGYRSKASDIHIEPYNKKIVIRFRIDGIMHNVLEAPKGLSDFIITRIKVLSKMRIDEHRSAQDGKFRYKAEEETIDIRVSVVPVTQGENIVMRLLSAKSRQINLNSLGLSDQNLNKVSQAIKKPHGMILVTGPTGSGKTTTLYTAMKILNKREVHIATIEDPVEYDIEGISQIQVNTKTNLTFAKGLRAIVRQDPDIIMVGEIRDRETAGIAVNSAMTGHLVLSTLHTNDAATSLPRLLDMGIEPFLVVSTVNLIIAQRLVRKICEKCRVSYSLSGEEKKIIKDEASIHAIFKSKGYNNLNKLRLYKGAGCKVCNNTGYQERIGIFEVLEMSEDIKQLILKSTSSNKITQAARNEGMTTMLEDGVEKVLSGITTLQEILRATKE